MVDQSLTPEFIDVARRNDGAVLVRVRSKTASAPDAVFAFRAGDPQYRFWEQRLREREQVAQ